VARSSFSLDPQSFRYCPFLSSLRIPPLSFSGTLVHKNPFLPRFLQPLKVPPPPSPLPPPRFQSIIRDARFLQIFYFFPNRLFSFSFRRFVPRCAFRFPVDNPALFFSPVLAPFFFHSAAVIFRLPHLSFFFPPPFHFVFDGTHFIKVPRLRCPGSLLSTFQILFTSVNVFYADRDLFMSPFGVPPFFFNLLSQEPRFPLFFFSS